MLRITDKTKNLGGGEIWICLRLLSVFLNFNRRLFFWCYLISLIMLLIRVLIRTRKKGQEGKHLKCNQVFLHLKRGDLIGNNKKTK